MKQTNDDIPPTEINEGQSILNIRPKIIWMTRTAVFIALLIVLQAVSGMAGNQLVTGTVVNAILAVNVMTCGLSSGLTLAAISPILAGLFGIGPHWALIPFIAIGNMVFVLLWDTIGRRVGKKRILGLISALVLAATTKFIVLFLGVVEIAVPLILELDEARAAVITAMFSVPQLITATSGGAIALIIISGYGKIIERVKRGTV